MAWVSGCVVTLAAHAAGPERLVAEWRFDEGQGDVARDSSGNGHDAKLFGASWAPQGEGFALSLDGFDDYIDCGTLPITGPITVEAWIKPLRKGHGLAVILGESLSSYLLTYYNTEVCDLYIGAGGNNVRGKLELGGWNHVVAAFDGRRMSMWVNGRLTQEKESKYTEYKTSGRVVMGTQGQPSLPRFKGLLDRVRLYGRALSGDEAVAHFKGEAGEYGFDPTWFSRVRVTPYYYFDHGEVVVQADCRGLQPLSERGRIELTLANARRPRRALHSQIADPAPEIGVKDITLPVGKLDPGDYVIRVSLREGKIERPVEEVTFTYPAKPSPVPSPVAEIVAPLPAAATPPPFYIRVRPGGGFDVTLQGVRYAFESRISWPNGEFNRLTAADGAYDKGEKAWKVSIRPVDTTPHIVEGGGEFYTIRREIRAFPTHIYVKDTYTNSTNQDLGLLIYNETPLQRGQANGSWLSGYDRWGRQAEMSYPDYGPSTFFTDAVNGMGIIAVDDVYVVHAIPCVEWEGAAGVGTERFALGPGKSYTLEWAVYPTASRDYYDFINAFRLPVIRVLGNWCEVGPDGQSRDTCIASVCYSDDEGHSWKAAETWVGLPRRGAMEPHVAELRDGRLLMTLRTQLGAVFQSESCDQGVTWSKPQTTTLRAPESMSALARIPQSGDLLIVWNHSLYDPNFDHCGRRTPLTTAVSRDDGRTWGNLRDIETDPVWEFTNPSVYFSRRGPVIITYVASRMDVPNPPGRLGQSCMPLKAVIADAEWFYT